MYIGGEISWNEVNKMDDAKIVQLYLDRDERAIPITADKYGKYCTSIANNILGNIEDAKECVNDTYYNTWNSIPPHRPKMLSTFLGKITRNLAFNRYKHNTAEKRGSGEMPAVLDELADCVSGNVNVELHLFQVRQQIFIVKVILLKLWKKANFQHNIMANFLHLI